MNAESPSNIQLSCEIVAITSGGVVTLEVKVVPASVDLDTIDIASLLKIEIEA